MNAVEDVEKLFAYKHLPEHLQAVSRNFHDLALYIFAAFPPSAERTLSLRELWASKNYAVWCAANK